MPQVFPALDQFGRPVVLEACYRCAGRPPGNYLCGAHYYDQSQKGWPDRDAILAEADRQRALAGALADRQLGISS